MARVGGPEGQAMRILMLGWEFPPFMAGGLGTACFGLTRALKRAGHEVIFILPKAVGRGAAEHVDLIGPDSVRAFVGDAPASQVFGVPNGREAAQVRTLRSLPTERRAMVLKTIEEQFAEAVEVSTDAPGDPAGVPVIRVAAGFDSPYGTGSAVGIGGDSARLTRLIRALREKGIELPTDPAFSEDIVEAIGEGDDFPLISAAASDLSELLGAADSLCRNSGPYGQDLFGDAHRYARIVAAIAPMLDFDLIHAHDWLAYPAGMAARHVTDKPLLCQVHATEFDRSGDGGINQHVYDIERAGVHAADRVVAVSRLTKEILIHRYGVDGGKIDVVYNGVDAEEAQPAMGGKIEKGDKIVLFLGRITMQKGPEYFIRAAARVLEKVENVKFVVAGSGDMAVRMIEEAASLGIGHKVLFTGFLRGRDVDEVYRMADCYVMPSVSEPFGIVALEAIQRNTPTIISKQSGVSEVLSHALKVDFWDIDDMADKIAAVLRFPPLSETLREHGPMELRRLTWGDSARKAVASYGRAIAAHSS